MSAYDMFICLGIGVFVFGLVVAFIGYKLGYMSK